MRTARARWVPPLLLTALLFAPRARADWTAPSAFAGKPVDARLVDAGTLAVATDQGAFAVVPAGPSITPFVMVAATVDGSGCLGGFDSSGFAHGSGACFNYQVPVLSGLFRVRWSPGGAAFACTNEGPGSTKMTYSATGGASAASWIDLPTTGTARCGAAIGASPISTASAPSGEWALYGLLGTLAGNLALQGPPYTRASFFQTAVMPTAMPLSTSLYATSDGGLSALVVDADGGLETGALVPSAGSTLSALAPFDPGTKARAVTFSHGADNVFGMALVTWSDGGTALVGAVPHPDPTFDGRLWKVRAEAPQVASARDVSCQGAQACVAITSAIDAGSLLLYSNLHAPDPPTGATVTLAEGQATTVSPTLADLDGDPLYVSWTQADLALPTLQLQPSVDGTSATVTAPAQTNAVCDGGVRIGLRLTAWDGLAGHQTDGGFDVLLVRGAPPGAPVVAPSSVSMHAGDPPATVTLSPSTCAPAAYAWQGPLTQNGITLVPDGGTAQVEVPLNVCDPAGAQATFTVVGTDPTFGNSDAGTLQVTVAPWGPPDAPVITPPSGTQPADASVTYSASQSHVCQTQLGFPGMRTVWTVDGGVPVGITLSPATVSGEIVSGTVTVSSLDCVNAGLELLARTEVTGDVHPSAETPLDVQIATVLTPLDQGQLHLSFDDGGFTSGTTSISGVNCVPDRGLSVRVAVLEDGGEVGATVAPVGSPWSVSVPTSCAPRSYVTAAQVVDAGLTAEAAWSASGSAPVLGVIDGGAFEASCGSPATWTLTHARPSSACVEQTVAWSEVSGPPLEPVDGGDSLVVHTVANDWSLVGEPVVIEARAEALGQASAPARIEQRIVPRAPPVSAVVRTSPTVATDTSTILVDVLLTNDTSCEVPSATWTASLAGSVYVDGSARIDGAPASATVDGDALVIEGVVVPGEGVRHVSYAVRPRLLGSPAPTGSLEKSGIPLSHAPVAITRRTTGCGCEADPGALGAWALLVIVGIRNRRRRPE